MTPNTDGNDDESEPTTKIGRYLQYANLVARFLLNVGKLVFMLTR